MTYKVVFAGHAICREDLIDTLPPIPTTEQTQFFKVGSPAHEIIWKGYLELREAQKSRPRAEGDWGKVKVAETADHMLQFREALNIFMRFLAGEGRDNCNRVISIEVHEEDIAAIEDKPPALQEA